jgi:hypothetical protein
LRNIKSSQDVDVGCTTERLSVPNWGRFDGRRRRSPTGPHSEALAVVSIAWDWIDRPITFVFRKLAVLSMDFVQISMCWKEVISTVSLIGVISLSLLVAAAGIHGVVLMLIKGV